MKKEKLIFDSQLQRSLGDALIRIFEILLDDDDAWPTGNDKGGKDAED